MDENIEKLLELAGNKNRYQYISLIITVFLWLNSNFLIILLPYLERAPLVTYKDNDNKLYINETLTNEVCDNYQYEIIQRFNYSLISEFKIECDKKVTAAIGSFSFLGNTLGAILFMIISKLISHKNNLIISSIFFSLVVFSCTLIKSVNYFELFFFFFVLIGCFGGCLCYSSLVISQETVSQDKRALFNGIVNFGYSLCGIVYSIVFYFIQDWRINFYIIAVCIIICCILIIFCIYNSPREYLNKKDIKNAIKILENIASFNNRLAFFKEKIKTDEYQNILNEFRGDFKKVEKDDEKQTTEESEEDSEVVKMNIDPTKINLVINEDEIQTVKNNDHIKKENKLCYLFIYPSVRKKFLILCFLWVGTRMSFNGINLSCKNFKGNFYLNVIIIYVIQCICCIITGPLMNIKKIGRKGTLWIFYSLIIITFLILSLIELSAILELIFNFWTIFCSSCIEIAFYTYSIEVYPTSIRNFAFGTNVLFGNGGTIFAPILLEYVPNWLFLQIFAGICGINAYLIKFLPETVGMPMIESIDELEK